MPSNPFDLTGKVALVTGGNGGIGLGMATGLAKAGADIVIWGRNSEKNQQARDVLTKIGAKVLTDKIDVTDERAVIDGVDSIIAEMGRIDFVAANAGIGWTQPMLELTSEDWRKVMSVNLDSAFWLFKAVCAHMVKRADAGDPGGSLLVISSIAAINTPKYAQAYAASKAGVIALAQSTAVEFGRFGIRANAVIPGFVRSDLSQHLQEKDAFNETIINKRVPLKRWGEPNDFSGLAVYLASDLSSFHTADEIIIDGGYTKS